MNFTKIWYYLLGSSDLLASDNLLDKNDQLCGQNTIEKFALLIKTVSFKISNNDLFSSSDLKN